MKKDSNKKYQRRKKKGIAEPIDFSLGSRGEKTRKFLEKHNVVSPDTSELIEVLPNLKIAPKKPFKNAQEKEVWICKMINKYKR